MVLKPGKQNQGPVDETKVEQSSYVSQGPDGPQHTQEGMGGFQQNQQNQQRSDMGNIGQVLNASFRRGATADQSSSFKENIDDLLKKDSIPDMDFRVLVVDGGKWGMHYSALVFCGAKKIEGQTVIGVMTGILEGSNNPPPPIQRNFAGNQINIPLTPMAAWDGQTWENVSYVVSEHFGSGVSIYNAGGEVIPADVDSKDTRRLIELIANAEHAIRSVMENKFPHNFGHFSITDIFNPAKDRLQTRFSFNEPDVEDMTGNPLRSDTTMRLVSTKRFPNQSGQDFSSFQHQSSKQIAELSGYIDLLYSPENPQPNQYNWGMPQQQQHSNLLFLPQMVITGVQPLDLRLTPEMFLLAIATSQLLVTNYGWANQFTNTADPVHNVGALGYRMPNPNDPNKGGEAIPTQSSDFTTESVFELVRSVCKPTPAFSIDCEDAGANSWMTSMLVGSAYDKPNAIEWVNNAANRLTGNLFSKYWQSNATPVIPKTIDNNRVHLGTYVDQDNVRRDLREIDTLAMLNLIGHTDISEVNHWESTFNDMSTPVEVRHQQRQQIMDSILGSRIRLRGFAERITFMPDFLQALVAACQEAGLTVDPDGLQTSFGSNGHAGNTILAQYVSSANPQGLMARGGPQNFQGWQPTLFY